MPMTKVLQCRVIALVCKTSKLDTKYGLKMVLIEQFLFYNHTI